MLIWWYDNVLLPDGLLIWWYDNVLSLPGGGYNKILRNSSSTTGMRDSAQTDSGIVGTDSHIYSEATEDPGAYLEPVRIRLDPDEEMYGRDMSTMEGSVADTDYMDSFVRHAPRSVLSPLPPLPQPGAINIDKYKVSVDMRGGGGVVEDVSQIIC